MKQFSDYTYADAKALFNDKTVMAGSGLALSKTVIQRRSPTAVRASLFDSGEHWQDGEGFIGQLPPDGYPGGAKIKEDIRKRFISENVIREVADTHVGGVASREPLWSFLPKEGKPKKKAPEPPEGEERPKTFEDETGETLTPWWNEREALEDIKKFARTLVLEETAVTRIFFPKGAVGSDGTIDKQPNIAAALDYVYFETVTADVAGVFTDPESQRQIGAYLFEEKDGQGNVTANCAELSYVITEGANKGLTACKVVRDKGEPDEFGPYKLGGRLLIHEGRRPALVTEQVQSKQKGVNLAHTMMGRNVNAAGARERTVSNAQHPKKKVKRQDPNNPDLTTETTESGTYETGAGAVMFLMGYPIRDATGSIVGYTDPRLDVHDPASVETFVGTADHYRAAIYGECHMKHLLIVGDGAVGWQSRRGAEKGYQRSLKDTKTPLDANGRWRLETSLRLAAHLAGQSDKYLHLRADFNCLLDVGEPEPDDIRVVMEMRKPGGVTNTPLISDETARNRCGVEDAAAELNRIEGEKLKESVTPPNPRQPPVEDKTGEELVA